MVQLIEPNRQVLESLEREFSNIVKVMKQYFTRANHIYYVVPDEEGTIETQSIIGKMHTMTFRVVLQSFSNIDEPIWSQVNIGQNMFEPIGTNDKEEYENVDDIIPEFVHPSSDQVSRDQQDDFSFHKISNSRKITHMRPQHHSIVELEQTAISTTNIETDDDINNDDSSSDESYNEDSDLDSNSDDELTGLVNIGDVNLREYGLPRDTAYHPDDSLPIAVHVKPLH